MPAVPVPPTFELGVSDTTELNLLRDAARFLLEPPRAMLRQTTLQSVVNGGGGSLIQFQTEDFDGDVDGVGGHDNAVNNTRYTARYPGRYQLGGGVVFAANATGRRATWWKVNGTDVNGSSVASPATATLECAVPARVISVFLNIGDYVELVGYQESGAGLNTAVATFNQSSMSLLWIGLT